MCASRPLSWACVCACMWTCALCVHVCHEAGFLMDACVPLALTIACVCNEAGSHMDALVLHAVASR